MLNFVVNLKFVEAVLFVFIGVINRQLCACISFTVFVKEARLVVGSYERVVVLVPSGCCRSYC